MEPASIATVGANGLPLDVAEQMSMLVSLGNYCVQHTFLVVHGLTVEGLLGADFLDKHKAVVILSTTDSHWVVMVTTSLCKIPDRRQAKCSQLQWTPLRRCQAGQFY